MIFLRSFENAIDLYVDSYIVF